MISYTSRLTCLTFFERVQVYMKDVLSALLEVASADSAKEVSATTMKGKSNKKKAKAKQVAEQALSTVNRNHLLSLFELQPSVLHSNHVASVDKFVAHQHLYDLPPREERVHKLEERLEFQMNALTASTSKTPATSTVASFPPPAVHDPAEVSPFKAGPSTEPMQNASLPSPSKLNGMDIDNTAAPPLSAGKSKDLAFELFPEIPATASGTEGKQKGKVGESHALTGGAENEPPLTAAPATVEQVDQKPVENAAVDISKDGFGKEKDKEKEKGNVDKAKKELQRGRFGIWKLLTGILEGTSGNQNMQSSHRFQHQSVM